jgi:hypothetical protein
MYDFLSTVSSDYDYTLTLRARGTIIEDGYKNQVIHIGDDNSEERITLSSGSVFYIELPFSTLSESDSGTIFDIYHDPAKANGMGNSFKYTAYDGHTYVVRFDCKLDRSLGPGSKIWGIPTVRLRVLGRIADA